MTQKKITTVFAIDSMTFDMPQINVTKYLFDRTKPIPKPRFKPKFYKICPLRIEKKLNRLNIRPQDIINIDLPIGKIQVRSRHISYTDGSSHD